MHKLLSNFKHGVLCFLLGTSLLSNPVWALTAAEIAAARTAAQGEGTGFGNGTRTGTATTDPRTGASTISPSIKPETLTNSGSTVGTSNAWGSEYTGTADTTLTDKATSGSMIGIGNAARGASVSGFTGYNATRSDQANQSNYFLSSAPVVKPSISQTEPWIVAAHAGIIPSASSTPTTNVCQPTPVDTPASVSDNTCTESYVPYIIPCTSQGSGVTFELVPAPVVAADIASYSCPASSGNTVTVLSGTQCISTTTTLNSATTNYTCPSGAVLSGTQCILTTVTSFPATVNYSCAAGETLNGTSCIRTTTVTQSPITNYGCSAGQVLSGSNCVSTATQSATTNYSCSSGTLSGTNCVSGSSYAANANYSCDASPSTYYDSQANLCIHDLPWIEGYYGNICAMVGLEYWGDSGNNSLIYCYSIPIVSYSCPDGGSLSGSTCSTLSSTPASVSLTCPAGYSISGSTCSKTTVTPATQTFSCNPGFTFNGSVCIQSTTSSSPATPSYSCPAGAVLSGTTCTQTTVSTTIATISYSCPAGAVLSGTTCTSTTVTTAAATVNYSCPTGYTLSGTQCTGSTSDRLVETLSSGCGSLEGLSN